MILLNPMVYLPELGFTQLDIEHSLMGSFACQACMLSNKPDDSVARLRQNLCHR